MRVYHFDMGWGWPNLQALELLVAVVDEGSVGAAARKVGIAQPNASRMLAALEARADRALLRRGPRGTTPTAAGVIVADGARELLDAAARFNELLAVDTDEPARLAVGASMTIAEHLLPGWLARLGHHDGDVRVDVHVANSRDVLAAVRDGRLQLAFVETPRLPTGFNAMTIAEDELVIVIAPTHPWASRHSKVSPAELAATPLVVREAGSGTRQALDDLLANLDPVAPAQVLQSNAAVRVAVAAGHAPAALSELAVRAQLATGELLRVPMEVHVYRPLTAIWPGPRRLTGHAAHLLTIARTRTSPIQTSAGASAVKGRGGSGPLSARGSAARVRTSGASGAAPGGG